MFLRAVLTFATALPLWGCGVIYTVPDVEDGRTILGRYQTDYDVEIIPLTYETVVGANLQPYVPPRLPLGFQANGVEVLISSAEPTSSGKRAAAQEQVSLNFATENLPPVGEMLRYRIGIGDVLLLSVNQAGTDVAGLSALISAQSKRAGYTVQDDGAIAVPDAGRIPVAGLTLQEAERAIFRALAAAAIDPAFTLEVAEFNSQRVIVNGMVGSPGLLPITLRPLMLEEALTLSGGIITEDPGSTWIQIHRTPENYRFKLQSYLRDPNLRRIILQGGDSIYVAYSGSDYGESPYDEVQARREQRAEAENMLASDRALFEARLARGAIEQPYAFIAGEVGKATEIELPFERKLSLANVLFSKQGGGINTTVSDYSQIYVLRRERDPEKAGGIKAYHLDAENAVNLAVALEFDIHANDIVFVSAQPVTSWNRVLSQLTPTPQFLVSTGQQASQVGR